MSVGGGKRMGRTVDMRITPWTCRALTSLRGLTDRPANREGSRRLKEDFPFESAIQLYPVGLSLGSHFWIILISTAELRIIVLPPYTTGRVYKAQFPNYAADTITLVDAFQSPEHDSDTAWSTKMRKPLPRMGGENVGEKRITGERA
jgi:hypothetical protein